MKGFAPRTSKRGSFLARPWLKRVLPRRFLTVPICLVFLACSNAAPVDEPGTSPDAALETYRTLLGARALTDESRILTPDSRALLQRGYSGGQQSREGSVLSRAMDQAQTVVDGDRAVIVFPTSNEASPYFLRRGAEGWQVDLASMARYIGFDAQNHWYFRSTGHPYSFAFE